MIYQHISVVRAMFVSTALLIGQATVQAAPFTAVSVPGLTPTGLQALAARFLDPGATLEGTPTVTGAPGQLATFMDFTTGDYTNSAGQTTSYDIGSGIILSTGTAIAAADVFTGGPSTNQGGHGDYRLTALGGGNPTFDAVSFKFSFTSELSAFTLNYAFASAEYPDSIGTQSNDIMAIYLNSINIATIQGTSQTPSVNNVNAATNSTYFTQYSVQNVTPFAYSGITTLLTATGSVISGANTLEIVIADGGDHIFDSAVFIQDWQESAPAPPVPEPSTWTTMAGAFGCALVWLRRRGTAS